MKNLSMWNVSHDNEKAIRRIQLLSGNSIYAVVDSLLSEMLRIKLAKEVEKMKLKHEKRIFLQMMNEEYYE
jgi:hypothetical protein